MVKKSEVQGAVNGPVSQFSNFQRFKHHVKIPITTQHDARQRCPALIELKKKTTTSLFTLCMICKRDGKGGIFFVDNFFLLK